MLAGREFDLRKNRPVSMSWGSLSAEGSAESDISFWAAEEGSCTVRSTRAESSARESGLAKLVVMAIDGRLW